MTLNMLPLHVSLYVFSALQAVAGLALVAPTQRSDSHLLHGWTPKPTRGPKVEIRANGLELRQNTGTDTCGYYVASTDLLFACPTRSQCAYSSNWMGCCQFSGSSTSSCFLHSRCYDSTAARLCTGDCADDDSNLICSSSRIPYCYTNYVYGSDAKDSTTYTYFDCRSSQAASVVYPMDRSISASSTSASDTPESTASSTSSTSSSAPPPPSSTSVPPPAPPPSTSSTAAAPPSPPSPGSSSSSSSSAAASPSGQPSSTDSGAITPASTASTNPSSGGSTTSASPESQDGNGSGGGSGSSGSNHTGAIAGGVVGGVAGVALLAAVVVTLVFRKRRHRDEAEKNVREISAQ